MLLLKKKLDAQDWARSAKSKGHSVGLVPTMGALHQGHLSLIEASRNVTSKTVCSIFVNPTQFNDKKDLEKYPVTTEMDIQLLEAAGVDMLFLPPVNEIYPEGSNVNDHYDLGYLETVLEGEFRPGHFQGVCQVVHRLLDIVRPTHLFLGQKDYQQCMIIKKLLGLIGMNDQIHLVISPTVRESDGLAMSSRNARLSADARQRASVIYESLEDLKKNLRKGSLEEAKRKALKRLRDDGFRPDYVEIADADSLQLVGEWDGKQRLVALAAAFLDEVRLIDNMLISP